jgi:hypothetical protein
MFLEQLDGVIAKAGVEGVQLAFSGEVDAHLEEASIRLIGGDGSHGEKAKGEKGEQGLHVILRMGSMF